MNNESFFRVSFTLAAVVLLVPHVAFAQLPDLKPESQPGNAAMLELGKPIERDLSGEPGHGYRITLNEGQYASVIIKQRGVDVIAQVLGTDGKSITEFDREVTTQGEERVGIVAESSGSCLLTLSAKFPKLPAGKYEIVWSEAREATEKDRLLYEARRLEVESRRLSDGGKYADALPLADKALELKERVLGPTDPDLYQPLINLFVINFLRGNHAKAEEACTRALTITENALGSEHPLVGRLLYNLAVFYSTRGDFARAEMLARRALSIQQRSLGDEHPHFAHSLNRLAVIARHKGDFAQAESLFERALAISEKALGEDHDDVSNAVNTMASLYREKGDYVRAEPLYQRGLTILEKKRGPDHPLLAPPLNNLANLYRDMGEFDKSEPLYKRAISIREKAAGSDHPDVAGSRASLAQLYYLRGDYAQAEPLYVSALATLEKTLGPNHPLVAFHLNWLARLYSALNQKAKAEPLLRRALGIYESTSGANSYHIADTLFDLAKLSAAEDNFAQAVTLQARANTILERHLNLNFYAGSERQKLAYLSKLPEQMNRAISLHVRNPSDSAARTLAATTVLQRKGRVQDALSNSLASLRSRFSPKDRALLDQLNSVNSRLARLVLSEPTRGSPADLRKQIDTLEEQREKIEGEISRGSSGYQPAKALTLADVQAAIPEDAALVEFAVYQPFNPKAPDYRTAHGESRYAAYIIRHNGEVSSADLGPANEIDSRVNALRRALRDPQRKDVQQLARVVDQKVMGPIRPQLRDAKQLLISPDGELNLIPFEALVDEQRRYLVETYSFTYLTSGRDLLRGPTSNAGAGKPTVFANPLFGEPAPTQLANATRPTNLSRRRQSITSARSLSDTYFVPLGGTAQEARSIQTFFPEANLLMGMQATESALKSVTAPSLLHLATHGFFLQDVDQAFFTNPDVTTRGIAANGKIENPLLRSGLALAGANLHKNADGDDGILTALEASGMNLWGTRLVVLSACDTGLGEVRNGEGVYGLRRAFVLAGAESLVMSLWPISDYSTRKLMTEYYKNLRLGMGRGAALRRVQLNLLKQDAKVHPFYWANFIQSGEWANLDGKR
jgi:CHAT domain-containing protein/Tfp pilus assembly protein PilF